MAVKSDKEKATSKKVSTENVALKKTSSKSAKQLEEDDDDN